MRFDREGVIGSYRRPLVARMFVKRVLNKRYGLVDYQTTMWGLAESPETREGFTAFMEKRAPKWIPAELADGTGRR